jgi:hypothetical protein
MAIDGFGATLIAVCEGATQLAAEGPVQELTAAMLMERA